MTLLSSEDIRQRWKLCEKTHGVAPTKIQLGTEKYINLIRELEKRIPPDFGHDEAGRIIFKNVLISHVKAEPPTICIVE